MLLIRAVDQKLDAGVRGGRWFFSVDLSGGWWASGSGSGGVGVLPTFSLLRLASCVFALRAEESNLADKGFLYAVLCPYLLRTLILQGGRS